MKTMKPVMSPPCAVVRLLDAIPEPTAAFHDAMERALRQTAAMPCPRARRMRPVRLLIACALTLLLLSATLIACIPAARAEVLSWFGFTSPEDYLAAGPDEREPNEALDAMIVSPAPTDTRVVLTEVGSVERISAELSARLGGGDAVTLGETLYDGNSLYMALTLKNGFGVWLVEQVVGGATACVTIPPEELYGFFMPSVPEEYASGEQPYYSRTEGRLTLTLPDRLTISGHLSPLDRNGIWDLFEHAAVSESGIDACIAEYLAENDVEAYLDVPVQMNLETLAGDDGLVTAEVSLELLIDLDPPAFSPPTRVLSADLGTVQINPTGYRSSSLPTVTADRYQWTGSTIVTEQDNTHRRFDAGGNAVGYSIYTNRRLSLDGITMHDARVFLAPTGGLSAEICFDFSEDWTQEQLALFGQALNFKIFINGRGPSTNKRGSEMGYASRECSLQCIDANNRQYIYRIGTIHVSNIERREGLLSELETVTLIPTLRRWSGGMPFEEHVLPDETDDSGCPMLERTYTGEFVPFEVDVPFRIDWTANSGMALHREAAVFAQYALNVGILRD